MVWLSSWLKEVIMVVLVATFVDLILPSRSMERYVKLVLSLLILLTLLGPLIKLLTDEPANKLTAAMNRMDQQSGERGTGSEESLQQIMAQAEEIKHVQQTQTLQWAGDEVASKMKEQIKSKTGQDAARVQVVLKFQPAPTDSGSGTDQQTPFISAVTVTMPDAKTNSKEAPDTGQEQLKEITVAPIESVQVDVQIEPEQDTGSSPPGTAPADKVQGTVNGNLAETISGMLASQWSIEPGLIVVQTVSEQNSQL